VPITVIWALILFALLKKADVSKSSSKGKNGQLADCRKNLTTGGLERSVVIGDIRFLIGLCSIADTNEAVEFLFRLKLPFF
jgi:hypothetical protein